MDRLNKIKFLNRMLDKMKVLDKDRRIRFLHPVGTLLVILLIPILFLTFVIDVLTTAGRNFWEFCWETCEDIKKLVVDIKEIFKSIFTPW